MKISDFHDKATLKPLPSEIMVFGNEVEETKLKDQLAEKDVEIARLTAFEAVVKDLRGTLNKQKGRIKDREVLIQEKNTDNGHLVNENETLWRDNKKNLTSIMDKDGTIKFRTSERDALQEEADKQRPLFEAYQKQVEDQAKLLGQLEDEVKTLRPHNVTLRQEKEALSRSLMTAQPKLQEKIKLLERDLKEALAAVRKMSDIEADAAEKKKTFSTLRSQTESDSDLIETLIGQRDKAQGVYKQEHETLKQVNQAYSALHIEYNTLRKKLQSVQYTAGSTMRLAGSPNNAKRGRMGNGQPTLLKVRT